jgi:hypothetical protein
VKVTCFALQVVIVTWFRLLFLVLNTDPVCESKQKLLECDHAIFVPIHFFCTRVINKNRLYFDPSSFSKIMQVSSIFTHRFSNTKQLEFKIEMEFGNPVQQKLLQWNETILIQNNSHDFLIFFAYDSWQVCFKNL